MDKQIFPHIQCSKINTNRVYIHECTPRGRNSSSHCVSECVIQRVVCIVNVTIKFWRYLKIPQERFGETFPQDPVNIFTVNYIKSSGKLDVKLTTSNRSRAWDILLPKGQINYHQTNLLATRLFTG